MLTALPSINLTSGYGCAVHSGYNIKRLFSYGMETTGLSL